MERFLRKPSSSPLVLDLVESESEFGEEMSPKKQKKSAKEKSDSVKDGKAMQSP